MHQIAMCVPQLFEAGSYPAEKRAVHAALTACIANLKSLDSRSRLEKGTRDQVVFTLPHVFHASSDLAENAAALEPLLECLCSIDLAYLNFHPSTELLYRDPCYYERTVVWDSTPALYARGYGDCKSLACSLVAEYRAAGQYARPVFRFVPPQQAEKGQFQYHILVLGPNGWEDPSKIKGMGKNENAYFQSKSA
jgi:hypothetical protein